MNTAREQIRQWVLRYPGRLAIALAVTAVICSALYFRVRERALADLGRPVKYLVADRDIPAQTQLTPELLAWIETPHQFVPPAVITSIDTAVGHITQTAFIAGEPVTRTRVAPPADGSGFAATIPVGMRAVTLPVDAVSGVAGLIEPGNFVDLLATFDFGDAASAQSFTMTLLERIPVLAVDRRAHLAGQPSREVQEQTVTLALRPDEAQRVTFAQENGHVRLALRPQAEPAAAIRAAPDAPATAASVTGMGQLVRRKEYRGR